MYSISHQHFASVYMDSPVLLRSFPKSSSITAGSYAYDSSWHKKKNLQKEYNFIKFRQPSLNHHYKGIEGGFTCLKCKKKYVVKAVSGPSFEPKPRSLGPKSPSDFVKNSLEAFFRFCRPYAIIHKVISTISISLLAVEKLSDLSPLFFTNLLKVIIAGVLFNIYSSGVNELYDVEIDKINKSYLPLASGEYSYRIGVIITASSVIMGFCLSWIVGSLPLFWTLFIDFLLWSAYSINLPLLRWKRSGLLTTMIMVATMAIVCPLGIFLHMQTHVFKKPILFPRSIIFTVAIMSFYSIAIAQLKDIPDTEGDRKHGIHSFSVLLGPKLVFWTCISLLEIGYGFSLLVGATSSFIWSKIITGLGHVVLASVFWYHAQSVDLKSKASTASFYMLIWKLLYAEYFLIPFVR